MENRRLLIDSSIIIDFLRKKDKTKSKFWHMMEEFACCISVITYFEILAGATDKLRRSDVDKVVKWVEILDFDKESALTAATLYKELKKKNKLIEFRDVFIAANFRHFKYPPGYTKY